MLDTIVCPNCGSSMNQGDPCPECEHVDDEACDCPACDYLTPVPKELALNLSRCVHNLCESVPHDIGLTLADIARAHFAAGGE